MCDALPGPKGPSLPRATIRRGLLGALLPILALCGALVLHVPEVLGQGRSGQPWLGVVMERAGTDPALPGVLVTRTLKRSPAATAALQPGDRILAVNGHTTPTPQALQSHIKAMRPGEVATLEILRGTKRLQQPVTLAVAPRLEDALAREFVGQPAPALTLKSMRAGGEAVALASLRGKPTVLEFWTTWCGPCKLLAQDLAKLHTAHPDRIHIVSVSAEDEATIGEYLVQSPLPWLVAHDPQERAHQDMMVHSFPVTFVLDSEHRVARVFIGGDQGPAIARLIGELLTQGTGPRPLAKPPKLPKSKAGP